MNPTPIHIEVFDEAGQPVKEATVVVVKSSIPFPELAMLTDDTGSVRLLLPAASFVFRASGRDGREGEITHDNGVEHVQSLRITIR